MKMVACVIIELFVCAMLVGGIFAVVTGPEAILRHALDRRPADLRLLDGLRLAEPRAVQAALADDASPNAAEEFCRHSALMIAASSGNVPVLRELLDRGARLETRDISGWTALSHAAFRGRTEAIEALLSAGADVHARDRSGLTPLGLAAMNGHDGAVRLLLARHASVSDTDQAGLTPLMLARASPSSSAAVIALLEDAQDR